MARSGEKARASGGRRRGSPSVGPLAVRICRVIGPEGETTRSVLYCPFEGRTVAVEHCEKCAGHERTRTDASGRSWVVCNRSVDEIPTAYLPGLERRLPGCVPIAAIARDPICVHEGLSVEEVATVFLDENISGAPVLNDEGALVGIVSKTDLARNRHEWSGPSPEEPLRAGKRRGLEEKLGRGFHVEPAARTTVAEVMCPVVFTISENSRLSEAAEIMADKGVHRLPVVTDDGEVVGIVSSMDILRWVARRMVEA